VQLVCPVDQIAHPPFSTINLCGPSDPATRARILPMLSWATPVYNVPTQSQSQTVGFSQVPNYSPASYPQAVGSFQAQLASQAAQQEQRVALYLEALEKQRLALANAMELHSVIMGLERVDDEGRRATLLVRKVLGYLKTSSV
jgi:SWI/SNF-related matrix-associated actin-dependent regulator of chromatin subfamily A3